MSCRDLYSSHHPFQAFSPPPSSSFPNSTGRFIPTRRALKRTRSSSVMPMPGLYRSNNIAYVRCACMYWMNCSESSIWDCADVVEDDVEEDAEADIVDRMRCCKCDGAESFWC